MLIIIAFVIAYFATGLLFTALMLLIALFIKKCCPSELQDGLKKEWMSIVDKYGDAIETERYLGMKITEDNWVKIFFIQGCVEMFLLWPKEIWNICMHRRSK